MRYATLEWDSSLRNAKNGGITADLNAETFQIGAAECYCGKLYDEHGEDIEFRN